MLNDTRRMRADTPTNSSRRGLLAGSTAALLAGAAAATAARAAPLAAPAAAGDDAELIRLHQVFINEEKIIHAWNAGTVAETVGEAAHPTTASEKAVRR
jgi:hypothetical protein